MTTPQVTPRPPTPAGPATPPRNRVWRYRIGYGAAALTYLTTQAFATVPSPLYPAYAARDHLSSLMITLIYAAYAVGVVTSLVFAGHLSDVWGRRVVLTGAVLVNVASCIVFLLDPSLPGLFAARIICGLAVGITTSTVSAYLIELFAAHRPIGQVNRVRMLSAATAVGGLGLGALMTGAVAAHVHNPLAMPYLVILAVFVVCLLGLATAPETRPRVTPRPPYRPQRIAVPEHARRAYFAATAGIAIVFAIFGLFVGLTGTVLGQVLHRHSMQLTGIVLFVVFGTGALVTVAAVRIGNRVLVPATGLLMTCGLVMLVCSVWLPTPSLALFVISGAFIGAGGSALFTASLTTATAVAPPARVAETLAGFFLAGYLGISIPVVGAGIALLHFSARTTLLGFSVILAVGLVAALPGLRSTQSAP